MATVKLLSDDELSSEARAVFDDIRKTRQSVSSITSGARWPMIPERFAGPGRASRR
ncbi:hypothetical protein V1283_001345 [Bradyrhizobium sp. AZCC 2262]